MSCTGRESARGNVALAVVVSAVEDDTEVAVAVGCGGGGAPPGETTGGVVDDDPAPVAELAPVTEFSLPMISSMRLSGIGVPGSHIVCMTEEGKATSVSDSSHLSPKGIMRMR